jgi:hypothetical protein
MDQNSDWLIPIFQFIRMKFRILTIILLLLILGSCIPGIKISKVRKPTSGFVGLRFESKGSYPKPVIKYFVKKIKSKDTITIHSGIELYKVLYFMKDEGNERTLVSGLLAIPRNKKVKGVVSYQHGTNNDRADAPSKPSREEGLGIAALFAGGGYICLIPDYIGFGVSNEVHTYLHVETTVNAVVDFLKIGSEICKAFSGNAINNLFLVGVSQGGHATAAVHRFIERNPVEGLQLRASSAIVGAYNLKEISIPYAIKNNSVFYLGYLANSYCHIYNKPPGSIISAPYDTLIPVLFDGNHSYSAIMGRLPKSADSLYTREIITDFKTGKQDWFTDRLAENQAFDWKPGITFRMYYGSNDKDVSPMDATNAYQHMKDLGGNVQLIGLGNLNHLQSAFSALPKTRAFFDSLTVNCQMQGNH